MAHSILIVDDEENIRQSLTSILEDEGFVVEAVESGGACLAAFERRPYSCVLLDIWLPDMDGLETLRRVKELAPDVAVVIISGHGTIQTAVQATKLGAFDFLEKPLSLERTLLTVKNAIEQKRLEREARELQARLVRDYEMIGESVPMRALRHFLECLSQLGFSEPSFTMEGPDFIRLGVVLDLDEESPPIGHQRINLDARSRLIQLSRFVNEHKPRRFQRPCSGEALDHLANHLLQTLAHA